jgi:hypothetical protein
VCIYQRVAPNEFCETALCAREFEYCDEEKPCCSFCPCGFSSKHCCNRFPLETTAGGDPIKCVNNVCQEYIPPVHGTACASDAKGCQNIPGTYYTETPPDCGGWGVLGADGVCVCHPTRTGEFCESALCSRKNQACGVDADCCNSCPCPDSESTCCPTYDAFDGPQQCVEGTCQVVSNPNPTSCKLGVACGYICLPLSGPWTMSVDASGTVGVGGGGELEVPRVFEDVQLFQDPEMTNVWMSAEPHSIGSMGAQLIVESDGGGVNVTINLGIFLPTPGNLTQIMFGVAHRDTFVIEGGTYEPDALDVCVLSLESLETGSETFLSYVNEIPPITSCNTGLASCDLKCFPLSGSWTVSVGGSAGTVGVDWEVPRMLDNVQFARDPAVDNAWVSTPQAIGTNGAGFVFENVDGGVSVTVTIGLFISDGTYTSFVVEHTDTMTIAGAWYDQTGSLCMPTTFAQKEGSQMFLWFTTNPNEVVISNTDALVCSDVDDYISISIAPNSNYPDTIHQLDTSHEWMQRWLYVDGVRTLPLLVESPAESTLVFVTRLARQNGGMGVLLTLVDNTGSLGVTLTIGEWTTSGVYTPHHSTTYDVPGASLILNRDNPSWSEVCLPVHYNRVAGNPDDPLSYISFGL